MANIKISQLDALTLTDAADLVPVTDTSASQTKRTTVGKIVGIINGDVDVTDDGTATISELPVSKLQNGDPRQLLQTAANGEDVEWTSNVDVPGTLDVTGAATLDSTLGVTGQSTLASAAVSDLTSGRVVLAGTSGELEDNAKLTFNGTQLDVDGNVVITGDLTVEGASTILETETVKVEDKNIELGVVASPASPTDVTADGGGITLKGDTDKTINWINATNAWTSSERFSVPLGTDDAPSLTFTGDPDTGIYSPGADQVAISTNGTGRVFVDASGNVGVGVSPAARLHIYGTYGYFQDGTYDGYFGKGNGVVVGAGASDLGISSATGAIAFGTGASLAERLRITADGKVGLGTSGPQYLTHIFGGSDSSANNLLTVQSSGVANDGTLSTNIRLINSTATSSMHGAEIRAIRAAGTSSDLSIRLYDASGSFQDKVYIKGDGKVGVGTTNPGQLLHLQGGTPALQFQPALDSQNSLIIFRNAADSATKGLIYYNHSNDSLNFTTNGTTTDASIDSSGRLLLGTSTARTNLRSGIYGSVGQIETAGTNAFAFIQNTTTEQPCRIILAKQKSGSTGGNTSVANGDNIGSIEFLGNDGANFIQAAIINASVDGTPAYAATALVNGQTYRIVTVGTTDFTLIGASANTVGTVFTATGPGTGTGTAILNAGNMPGRLVFSTTADGASSPTERMRIDSSGSVYIPYSASYTWNTSAPLKLLTGAVDTTGAALESTTTAGGTRYHLVFSNSNGVVGSISTSGSATAYNTSSDYRLKENVTAVTDGITRLQQLKPSRFNFITDPDTTVDGFIAHEVQTIVPEAITGEKDAVDDEGNPVYQGIDQSKLVPLLTAALQEAIGEIESLKARVAALEAN